MERSGTVWSGTLALRDASVGGQQAGDIEIRPRGQLEKIEIKIFENTKNEILIFSNMLFVRYPWGLWGFGNVSKTLLAMSFGRSAARCLYEGILKSFGRPPEKEKIAF